MKIQKASSRLLLLLVLASIAATSACTRSDEDDLGSGEDAVESRIGNTTVTTAQDSLRLLGSYNSLVDELGEAPCVIRNGGDEQQQGPSVVAGNVERHLSVELVDSRSDLARAIGLDLSAAARLGVGDAARGEARGSFGLVNSFKKSSTVITLVMRSSASYRVTNARSVHLTPEATAALGAGGTADPAAAATAFLRMCGSGYANALKYEAQFVVVLRYDAPSEEVAREIRANLSGSAPGNVPGADLNAEARASFTSNASRRDVKLTVTSSAYGFADSTSVLAATGTTQQIFETIDKLKADMVKSVTEDYCRDAGDRGPCGGGDAAPGYDRNTARHARPVEVTWAAYPGVSADVSRTMRQTLRRAEGFLMTLGDVRAAMDDAFYGEVQPFFDAPENERGLYNVAPPGKPQLQVRDVIRVATEQRAALDPESGGVARTLRNAIDDCRAGARSGDYADCPADPAANPALTAAKQVIDSYRAQGRVLRLEFTVKGPNRDPRNVCSQGSGLRLPDALEMAQLAPAVASGAGGRLSSNRVWFAGEGCGVGKTSLFVNPPGNTKTFAESVECDAQGSLMGYSGLCIASAGPFGTIR